jgi:hypothetical protein
MDNVIQFGGKKYTPENMAEKHELLNTLKDLDAIRFRRFIKTHLPELSGWLDKTDEQLHMLMHELRSQYIGMGDDFVKSRNVLRIRQFGYSKEEAAERPLCVSCKWFRNPPDGELRACMHLGSVPQDISCRGYIDK